MKKKWMTLVLAASMIAGSVPATAYASKFVDIDTAPWEGAIAYIDEAQSLGLMNGYLENGSYYCKPTNSVTYSETVQLIYSIMKAAGEVNITSTETTKWSQVLSAYSIDTWVQPAATYALEAGIISSTELTYLRDGSAADREAVGVIYGKAMATLEAVNTAATLGYNDAASISSAAVPYLDLLYTNSIMAGDTENYFYPNNNINRAEMAVLSVRMHDAVSSSGSSTTTTTAATSGTVTGDVVTCMALGNAGLYLAITSSSGSSVTATNSSSVSVTYDGTSVTPSDVGIGDEVTITYANGVLYSVDILDSVLGITVSMDGAGDLVSVTSSKIVVDYDGDEYTYYLDDPYVEIDGEEISLSTFKSAYSMYEYEVELTFDSSDYVYEIIGTNLDPTYGMLVDVDDDEIVIDAGGVEYEYDMDDPDIELDGDDVDVDDLYDAIDEADDDDEYIYVELEFNSDDEVDEIVAEYADLDDLYSDDDDDDDDDEDAEYEVSGILEDIDDYDSIEVDLGYGTYEYDLSDEEDTEFDYDGKSSVDTIEDFFDDIWDDDDYLDSDEVIWVTVYLDDDFEVLYIEAELMDEDDADEELSSGEGYLTSVDEGDDELTIDDDNGNGKFTFYCDDPDVEYEDSDDEDDYDDDLGGLEDFFDDYDEDDYECYVELEFDDYGIFVIGVTAYEPE